MRTQENNKTIAEFMGTKVRAGISVGGSVYYYWNNPEMKDDEAIPDYDCDWNELIKVVKFIERIGYICIFYSNRCFIQDIKSFTKKTQESEYCDESYGEGILNVYNTILGFINWYNNHNKH